jgi:MOSC domain-containing protein YiiM
VNSHNNARQVQKTQSGKVIAVCTSQKKGIRKRNIERAELQPDWGIVGDAHAADWHRQVSLLAWESIEKMRALGLNVNEGSFAENITTQGLSLVDLPVGTHLQLGEALVRVTQIGKECHDRCAIYYQAGDCVMPREGIFVQVQKGGEVRVGDTITVLDQS